MSDLRPPRRPRYSGANPRRWAEKYKEHRGDALTLAKVEAGGKTAAGSHRPIMVEEILAALAPRPGETAADCTLGFGGHAAALLGMLAPGGRFVGLDADPLELPRTEARLRARGFGPEVFTAARSNFAGLPRVLGALGWDGADVILADLGVSSMQLDDPARGFSFKHDGPLDLRLNPRREPTARALLARLTSAALAEVLRDHADEPHAAPLAAALAGRDFAGTLALATAVRAALPARVDEREHELSVRRVFQALRIAVNDEFAALEALLRALPGCLRPGGRAAFLTFHSGEDRRVKQAFLDGLRTGAYAEISREVIRPSPAEIRANPRASSAKLRWARRVEVRSER